MSMKDVLGQLYRKTGVHGAPPGTLLHKINAFVHSALHKQARNFASIDTVSRGPFGSIPYYNISRLRRSRIVNGLALVFFVGAGDYLMTTTMIQALHEEHPDLPIWAYVSANPDSVNSPLVAHLLRSNPLVSRVSMYHGRPRFIWTEYDFSDALEDIPDDFVVLPVIYDTDPMVVHRETSLLETFGLRVELPIRRPIAYPSQPTNEAIDLVQTIRQSILNLNPKGVIFVHFGARSSSYDYPHVARLAWLLAQKDYLIVSFTPTGLKSNHVINVDIKRLMINDSIEVIRQLKSQNIKVTMISINSVMWPISAALEITNLGLHIFWDPSVHQYLYPNIFLVSPHLYPKASPSRTFLARLTDFEERSSPDGSTLFSDYLPEYVVSCFERMISEF